MPIEVTKSPTLPDDFERLASPTLPDYGRLAWAGISRVTSLDKPVFDIAFKPKVMAVLPSYIAFSFLLPSYSHSPPSSLL